MPPKADRGAKCPQEGCSQRLNQATLGTCKGCGRDFCKNHCFPSDHDCQGPAAASLARSSSAPQLAKQPAAPGLGVLVSATKAASPLSAANGSAKVPAQASAGAAAAAASALAAQLEKADTRSLLDALLSTSPCAGSEAQPLLVRALGEEAAEVRALAASKGTAVVDSAASHSQDLLRVLLAYLELDTSRGLAGTRSASVPSLGAVAGAAGQAAHVDTRQDRIKAGLAPFLVTLAKHLDAKTLSSLPMHLAGSLCSPSERVQAAVGDVLQHILSLPGMEADLAKHTAAQLLARLDEGRGIAHGLAGVVASAGAQAMEGWGVLAALTAVINDKAASVAARDASLYTLTLLCGRLGPSFGPYMVHLMPTFLGCYSDAQATVRDAAEAAATAVASQLAPQGVKLVMAPILQAMGDKAWKKKESALSLLAILARRTPRQVGRCLPEAIPKVVECLQDTHPKVVAAATAALADVAAVVSQPEIQKNMSGLIEALSRPDQKTSACLEKLMETTFVNAMDSAALAVVVPVVTRGLRERSAELKKIAAMTAGNIFALVNEPRDMAPFVPIIFPEVTKAAEHSHPDVRKAAERAKEKLLAGAHMESGTEAVVVDHALAEHVRGSALAAAVPPVVLHFASEVVPELLEDKEVSSAHGLRAVMVPVLSPYTDDATIDTVCASVVALHEERLRASAGADALFGKDVVVNIPNIILAFAGRVLLNKTPFYLERGRRYGLVGNNGVGKTTLLTRVAAGDITGFPKDVSCYYIQHEILAEAGTSVSTFMEGQVPEGCGPDQIKHALTSVGFSDERAAAAVSELSGGWRMKLAIARSMLWNADLLLLDEPTNHLDVAAVEWLANYVNNLKCTVCLVSHDYEFLDLVLTDVIHIADQKLTYYPGSFKHFQKLRPEIVAGLPSPASAIQRAKEEMAAAAASGSGQESSSSMHRSASSRSMGEAAPVPEAETAMKTVKPLNFPDPGPLDGIKSRLKPVMSMKNVLFKYESAAVPILTDVNVRLSLTSRVALVGENGAGKTTLLKLLVGDLEATRGVGEVWKHHNLRVAYIAQHSMHHLEDHVESTPLAYIQDRFYLGRDKELAKLATLALDDEDQSLMTQRGEIEQIVGRAERGGKQLWYEVIKVGRKKDDTVWEPLEFLQKMKPYVMKLVRHYDETMKAMQSGVDTRPLTAEEVKKHLADFGLDEDLAVSKIRRFSGGQRSRLVLAAAMWNRPHLICLDEPTNYIDNALLAALTKALQQFRGGVITISHNEAFVAQLCTEKWHVGGGVVRMEVIGAKKDILLAKEAAKAARMSAGATGADEEDA